MAPNRLFWSAGRGSGDDFLGVEVWVDHRGVVRRRIVLRGKHGRENIVAEEAYSREEYREIIHAEGELLAMGSGKGALELVEEALIRLRLAYATMGEEGGAGDG